MTILKPAANATLSQSRFTLSILHGNIPGAEIDISAFLLTAGGKMRGDTDMCFYGQTCVENGAVVLETASGFGARFDMDLSKIGRCHRENRDRSDHP